MAIITEEDIKELQKRVFKQKIEELFEEPMRMKKMTKTFISAIILFSSVALFIRWGLTHAYG